MPALEPKLVHFSEEARSGIIRGIDKVADAVKVTLGPRGRLVLIERPFGDDVITKDGVTVARSIELSDALEQMGAKLIRSVASKTVDVVGDGTTTSTVLAQKLIHEGRKLLLMGYDPQTLRAEMDQAYEYIAEELKELSQPVGTEEDLFRIASISANDEGLGRIVADAYGKVGHAGILVLEKGNSAEVEVEIVPGMRFNRGYTAPQFVTDPERMVSELLDVPVVVIEEPLNVIHKILPLIESIVKETGKRDVVIIADDFSSDVLGTFILNGSKGNLRALCIKAPEMGDRKKEKLEDIAILTGATLISEEAGLKLEQATSAVVGHAGRITSTSEHTTIVSGGGSEEKIAERAREIELQLEKVTWPADKERLQGRIASLKGGIGILKVGAETEIAMKEKYHRLEDAIQATRAAIEEGIVPGGGTALIAARPFERCPVMGQQMVYDACTEPLRQIVKNANGVPDVVVEEVVRGEKHGFDARQMTYQNDMIAAGIIDPTKVVRTALQSAISIAGLVLCTEVAIVNEPRKEDDKKTKK